MAQVHVALRTIRGPTHDSLSTIEVAVLPGDCRHDALLATKTACGKDRRPKPIVVVNPKQIPDAQASTPMRLSAWPTPRAVHNARPMSRCRRSRNLAHNPLTAICQIARSELPSGSEILAIHLLA